MYENENYSENTVLMMTAERNFFPPFAEPSRSEKIDRSGSPAAAIITKPPATHPRHTHILQRLVQFGLVWVHGVHDDDDDET